MGKSGPFSVRRPGCPTAVRGRATRRMSASPSLPGASLPVRSSAPSRTSEQAQTPPSPTLDIWQRRASKRLSDEDRRQIRENLANFFRLLGEWERAEQARASVSTSS